MTFLLKIVSLIKGREISLDKKVEFSYFSRLLIGKIIDFLRGVMKIQKSVFVGRSTKIIASKQFFSEKGVEIGPYCEIDCLSRSGLHIGRSSKIGGFSVIKVSGSLSDLGKFIRIGHNVGIGEYAHIGGAGGVSIGDDTIIGAYFSVHPENHNFSDLNVNIRLQGVSHLGVTIGANCWIGAKVTILDGTNIGNGCVIAAGAVVKGSFPDNCVLGGVPAKIIKYRN